MKYINANVCNRTANVYGNLIATLWEGHCAMPKTLRTLSGWAALIVFCVFFANVAVSAATRTAQMGNVAELALLLLAALLFVISILAHEAALKRTDTRTLNDQTDFQGGKPT
ncbi:hypothetical protein N9H93_02210 [Rhizobiaceae bacterium]|nr:hypothetical protein [Rhizobiaceae bacterium]